MRLKNNRIATAAKAAVIESARPQNPRRPFDDPWGLEALLHEPGVRERAMREGHWNCIDFLAPFSPRKQAMEVYRSAFREMPGFARFLADEEAAALRAAMEPAHEAERSSNAVDDATSAADATQTSSQTPKTREAARL